MEVELRLLVAQDVFKFVVVVVAAVVVAFVAAIVVSF